ncbi:MAG: hypothetical protein U0X75_13250 [Acidobacteriota bacterium]
MAKNLYNSLPNDEKREGRSKIPAFMEAMVERRLLGDKTGGGFYKKVGKDIVTLDTATFEYRPQQKAQFASLGAAKQSKACPNSCAHWLCRRQGRRIPLAHHVEAGSYAANRIPEIADNIVEIDNAMKWGFAHEMGPFEKWDAIGVEKSVARLKEGRPVPAMLKDARPPEPSFYKTENGQQHASISPAVNTNPCPFRQASPS